MTRIYKVPFATLGDDVEVMASNEQPDGKVSFPTGWTPVYELEGSNPAYKPIGRGEMNGLFGEITEGIGELQLQGGVIRWRAIDGGFNKGAIVYGADMQTMWQSTIDSNTTDPDSAGASGWAKVIDIATEQDIQDRKPGKLVDAAGLAYARFPTTKIFESSGSFTVPAGVTKVRVRVVGGGGGSAGGTSSIGGAGGSGGGYSEGVFDVLAGEVYAVTVGAGGSAGANNGGAGGAGGNSSFGTLISATGGQGTAGNFPGDGGTGSGGQININGSSGMSGNLGYGAYLNTFGGSSYLGAMTRAYNEMPRSASTWGGGAAAKGSIGVSSGAAGYHGVVIVEW